MTADTQHGVALTGSPATCQRHSVLNGNSGMDGKASDRDMRSLPPAPASVTPCQSAHAMACRQYA